MVLVPIPTSQSFDVAGLWMPFVKKVARRMKIPLDELLDQIEREECQVHLVWDETNKTAVAAIGTRVLTQGGETVGQIHWCGGKGLKHILGIVPDLETYMRDHLGCARMTFTGREGWRPLLERQGYAVATVTMGKAL